MSFVVLIGRFYRPDGKLCSRLRSFELSDDLVDVIMGIGVCENNGEMVDGYSY